jgi:pimeloyl-ACP methyl ester carboxylesterase
MPHPAEKIRFCTSRDGTRIAFGICGRGPPLLWSPHWVHHLKADWHSPVWGPWLALLMQRHTLIRYDWRGCGLSDRDGIQFSFEKHIEDLEAVAEASGHKSFAFIGNGSGGTAGIAYAAKHPEKVTHLIVNGGCVRGRLVRGNTPADFEEAQTRLKVFEIGWNNDSPAYGHFITALHIPDGLPEHIRSYKELIRLTTTPANAIDLLRSYWEADVSEMLTQIACPTLVLHTRMDALIPFEEGRLIASLVPGAQFVPLENRNHVLLEQEPAWRQFVDAFEDFLPPPATRPGMSGQVLAGLTPREHDVLELVARGLDNHSIAVRLGISEKTVRNQVSSIFSKLGVNTRARAIVRARDAGFGRPSST